MAEYYITRKQAKELGKVLIQESETHRDIEGGPYLKPIVFISLGFTHVPIEAVTLRVVDQPGPFEDFIWPK